MPPPDAKTPVFSIDRATLVPIGLLVAVVLSSISATVWINTRLLSLANSIDRLEERFEELRTRVTNGGQETWTMRDMTNWVELSNAQNSTIRLPSPKHQ